MSMLGEVIQLCGLVLPTGTDQRRCSAQRAPRQTERTSCRATKKPTTINKYFHSSKVLTLSTCQHHQPHQIGATYTACLFLVLFLTFIVSSVVLQGCVYGEGKVVQPVSDGGFEPASYFTNPPASHSTGKTAITKSKGVLMLQ